MWYLRAIQHYLNDIQVTNDAFCVVGSVCNGEYHMHYFLGERVLCLSYLDFQTFCTLRKE